MSGDTRSITVFGTMLSFEVDRSSRRRNITIEIPSGGQAVVKAPLRAADAQIDKVVRDNARWILTKLAESGENASAKASRKYVDGETLLYKGDEYLLQLVEATAVFPVGEVMLQDGTIAVSVFSDLAAADPEVALRKPLVQWYRRQAENMLPPRAAHFAGLFGVEVSQVLIRDQKRRWGSCNSKGVLRLNYRIIMASVEVIDYLVAHEVCHLLEMNHSPAYWKKLEAIMPDYRARRHELKRVGRQLVL